jgi:hypothetical protein
MNESGQPEKRPSDLERRHPKVREWVLHTLAVAMAFAAVQHYKPEGIVAIPIVFVGAYVVAKLIGDVFWLSSAVWLGLISVLILVCTLSVAFTSLPLLAAVLLTILPGIGQAYLMWALWPATSALSHPLTLLSAVWLLLLAITIFQQDLFVRWRPRSKLGRKRA